MDDRRFQYPPSRFRYLRVRVERDPEVDEKPVEIAEVVARKRVEVPGEFLDQPARFGPREAVRADGGPGSAWVFDLGGDGVPCDRLTARRRRRRVRPQLPRRGGGPPDDPDRPFRRIGDGLWRRRAGEPRTPLFAEFGEVTASRLKLVVTDHRNPPLGPPRGDLPGGRAAGRFRRPRARRDPPAALLRQPQGRAAAVRLRAEPAADPRPAPGPPDPARRRENPAYRPEPKPFTERWPWLIYLVLGAISLGLAAIIVSLARTAFRAPRRRQAGVAVELSWCPVTYRAGGFDRLTGPDRFQGLAEAAATRG